MLIISAFACVTSSYHTNTGRDVIVCNKKCYANDAESLCKFLQDFYFIFATFSSISILFYVCGQL